MTDSRSAQCAKILDRLIATRGDWVSLSEITDRAAQYNARILELRRLVFQIENLTKEVDGVRHSRFRMITGPEQPIRSQQTDRIAQAQGWLSVARGQTEPSPTGSLFGDLSQDRSCRE